MGTLLGFGTPFLFSARPFLRSKVTAHALGAGTGEPPSSYGAVDRSIDFGVPLRKGMGLFLMGAVDLRDENIMADQQPCLGFRERNSVGNAELSQQIEDARRNFAARRASAAVASLKR
jgi:hypothetical protein